MLGYQHVDRASFTTKRLDRSLNPPQYVDDELPTQSMKIFARQKQGTLFDPSVNTPGTPMVMGSKYFSGSHYDFDRGTFSLRITRRSIHLGSVEARNTSIQWAIRHSRLGTVDAIPFYIGTHTAFRMGIQKPSHEVLGGPMNPIYTFGPGTIWAYWHRDDHMHGTFRVYSSLEGIVS